MTDETQTDDKAPDPVAENIHTARAMAGHVGADKAADWLTRQVPGITLEEATAHVKAE